MGCIYLIDVSYLVHPKFFSFLFYENTFKNNFDAGNTLILLKIRLLKINIFLKNYSLAYRKII
jgi:hypothetical protein